MRQYNSMNCSGMHTPKIRWGDYELFGGKWFWLGLNVNPNLMDNHYWSPKTVEAVRKMACFRLYHDAWNLLSLAWLILLRNWPYSLVRTVTITDNAAYANVMMQGTWQMREIGIRGRFVDSLWALHAWWVFVSLIRLPKPGWKDYQFRKTDSYRDAEAIWAQKKTRTWKWGC